MDQATIRLNCLKLASSLMSGVVHPDADYIVGLAKCFEAYVLTNGELLPPELAMMSTDEAKKGMGFDVQQERRPRGRPRKADNL